MIMCVCVCIRLLCVVYVMWVRYNVFESWNQNGIVSPTVDVLIMNGCEVGRSGRKVGSDDERLQLWWYLAI